MTLMRIGAANRYVKERGILLPNNQVQLTEPLKVFKKVRVNRTPGSSSYWRQYDDAIANLVIPASAIVNLADSYDGCKMRASQAYCFSVVVINNKKEVVEGYSAHDKTFKYHSGKSLGMKDEDFENLVINQEKYYPEVKPIWATITKKQKADATKRQNFEKVKCEPTNGFGMTAGITCAPGIHFFLELKRALNY